MSPAIRIRMLASLRSRARGAVYFIALIVLVAMTLAGIAIMRSVDTATLIAGNLAFKQGTVQSADNGIEQGYQWLLANRPTLSLDNAARGPAGAAPPYGTNAASWVNSVTVGTDAAGNTIWSQIHRMCNCANTTYQRSLRCDRRIEPVRARRPDGHRHASTPVSRRKLHDRRARIPAGPQGLLPHHSAHAGAAQHHELHPGHGGGRAVKHAEF